MFMKSFSSLAVTIVECPHNYPTMAEAYRVAALNRYNRLF